MGAPSSDLVPYPTIDQTNGQFEADCPKEERKGHSLSF